MNEYYNNIRPEFAEYLKIAGHTKYSAKQIQVHLYRFFDYIDAETLEATDIDLSNAHLYQKWLIDTGCKKYNRKYAPATILSYMGSVKIFYNFLKIKGIVYTNPFYEVQLIREEKKIPHNLLKENEMQILLNELGGYYKCNNFYEKKKRYRMHVIAELMYSTGLRSAEVGMLKVENIDFDRSLINVIDTKTGYPRVAYLNEYANRVLKIYVERIRGLIFTSDNEKNNNLFGVQPERMTRLINNELKAVCKKLNLNNKFTSHGFRHCVGYHLLKAGCDIRNIQQILGHRVLRSTEIYTKVDKEDLKKVFDKYHPRTFNKNKDKKN